MTDLSQLQNPRFQLDTIQVGQAFPHLVLPTIDTGEPLSVADFRGEKLILHLFASW